MRIARWGTAVAALGIVGTLVIGACADKKGALMLAINTDMKAPKDVSAVSVTISTNGAVKHSFIGRVTPQGEVLLPATLAIVEPEDKGASIRIRVMAFQDRKPRILRDVRTTVPTGGRTALLRIPLNFVNDGSTKSAPLPDGIIPAPLPGTGSAGSSSGSSGATSSGAPSPSAADFDFFSSFQPECPDVENQTWIDGVCQDNAIDPDALPDFAPDLVGDGTDVGACFDVPKCYASAILVANGGDVQPTLDAGRDADVVPPKDAGADSGDGGSQFKDYRPTAITFDRASCSLALNGSNAARLNLAIVTPDTGECVRPGECYIPLDHGDAGWKEQNGRVQLPTYVCTLIQSKSLRLATSDGTCVAKEASNPICVAAPPKPAAGGSIDGTYRVIFTGTKTSDGAPRPGTVTLRRGAGLAAISESCVDVLVNGGGMGATGDFKAIKVGSTTACTSRNGEPGSPMSRDPLASRFGDLGGQWLVGTTEQPVCHLRLEGSTISGDCGKSPFTGTISADGQTISGNWIGIDYAATRIGP